MGPMIAWREMSGRRYPSRYGSARFQESDYPERNFQTKNKRKDGDGNGNGNGGYGNGNGNGGNGYGNGPITVAPNQVYQATQVPPYGPYFPGYPAQGPYPYGAYNGYPYGPVAPQWGPVQGNILTVPAQENVLSPTDDQIVTTSTDLDSTLLWLRYFLLNNEVSGNNTDMTNSPINIPINSSPTATSSSSSNTFVTISPKPVFGGGATPHSISTPLSRIFSGDDQDDSPDVKVVGMGGADMAGTPKIKTDGAQTTITFGGQVPPQPTGLNSAKDSQVETKVLDIQY